MASASHLAELEIEATDVAAAWNALEPVIAQHAGPAAVKSDYHVGQPDSETSVGGADLSDCLNRVDSPTAISVTYTADGGPDPTSIELRLTRHRRHKELIVNLRVAGPQGIQTLGLFDRTENGLTDAINRFTE